MKAILYSIAVILCLGVFSCSKKEETRQLVLRVSDTEIEVGKPVTFEITAGGQIVDADLYIDDQKIAGLSHTFVDKGGYTAVAKKSGYLESQAHEIKAYQIDVHIAGMTHNGTRLAPAYWKNGSISFLNDGSGSTRVSSILVDDGDVYIAGLGRTETSSRSAAIYWKNGNAVGLTDGDLFSEALGIFVDNGDVYVAGYERTSGTRLINVAKYWKHGKGEAAPVAVTLSDGSQHALARSIFVDNGDVHIVGYESNGTNYVATYWKNDGDNPTYLVGVGYSDARSIIVDDGDVHIVGCEGSAMNNVEARYWKNGSLVATELGSGMPSSMFVDDGDIYVSIRNTLWKNGIPMAFPDEEAQYISSVFVEGDDVYAVGSRRREQDGREVLVYWKNGSPVQELAETFNRDIFGFIYVARSY